MSQYASTDAKETDKDKSLLVPERYVMVLLCAACCFINYADRVNMSVAIIALGDEYGYNKKERGIIMSSFYLGYLPMQLGAAMLCRRYGGKKVLSCGAFLWSLFTILTPGASWMGLAPLLICRVCMGLSEAVAFPSVFHFLAFWVPAHERALSTAVFLTGAHIGTTVALVISPLIIRFSSWHVIFYSFGAAGYVWIVLWNLIAYDRDDKCAPSPNRKSKLKSSKVSEQREDSLPFLPPDGSHGPGFSSLQPSECCTEITQDLESGKSTMTWRRICFPSYNTILFTVLKPGELKALRFILTSRKTLVVCVVQAIFGLIHYVILSWLPSYFQDVYNMKTESLSFTFVPYLAMAIASNVSGYIADRLVRSGMPTTFVRKAITLVANIGAATTLIAFSMAQSVSTALVCISTSMAFMSLNTGGFESTFLDMTSPGMTGLFKAVANTMASFSGLVAIPLAAVILEWSGNSWRFTFGSLSIWYVLMTVLFIAFGTSERILVE